MQSSGSTSSQASLCSSDGFLSSDTEHTEDDADVFVSEGDGSGARRAPRRACDSFENTSSERSGPCGPSRSIFVTSSGGSRREKGRTKQSEGDRLFAKKCAELQGFIRPLLELLNGLKNGRFDRGLSSFQQSVAMDRIQRIVGVLQKPTTGEKHLRTLLQVEMMLKLWFPQISQHAPADVAPQPPSQHDLTQVTPPHKHKDQLHMPVKKRKLSWSDTNASFPPAPSKSFRQAGLEEGGDGGAQGGNKSSSATFGRVQRGTNPTASKGLAGAREDDVVCDREGELPGYKVIRWSEPSLTWVHVTPILSHPKSCSSHEGRETKKGNSALLAVSPATTRGSPATQDSSVSSTTQCSEPCHLSSQHYKPVGCHNELGATDTAAFVGGATEPFQGRSKSLPALMPLNTASGVRMQSPTQT